MAAREIPGEAPFMGQIALDLFPVGLALLGASVYPLSHEAGEIVASIVIGNCIRHRVGLYRVDGTRKLQNAVQIQALEATRALCATLPTPSGIWVRTLRVGEPISLLLL